MKYKTDLVKEVTPNSFSCGLGACPSIFETKETYLIVGANVNKKLRSEVIHRIGDNEEVIEIPKQLLKDFLK